MCSKEKVKTIHLNMCKACEKTFAKKKTNPGNGAFLSECRIMIKVTAHQNVAPCLIFCVFLAENNVNICLSTKPHVCLLLWTKWVISSKREKSSMLKSCDMHLTSFQVSAANVMPPPSPTDALSPFVPLWNLSNIHQRSWQPLTVIVCLVFPKGTRANLRGSSGSRRGHASWARIGQSRDAIEMSFLRDEEKKKTVFCQAKHSPQLEVWLEQLVL